MTRQIMVESNGKNFSFSFSFSNEKNFFSVFMRTVGFVLIDGCYACGLDVSAHIVGGPR